MKKITIKAVQAFEKGKRFSQSNTCVESFFGGGARPVQMLYLWGHPIAELDAKGRRLWVDACGWLSNTTKERLNGLQGVSIVQKNWQWYLNGKPWDGKRVCVNDWGGVYHW